MYRTFVQKLKAIGVDSQENTVRAFQKYFIEQIEKWLIRSDKDTKALESNYSVADLQLAFDNDGMLKMLEKRANALKKGKFAEAQKIQKEMTDYKNENLDELTVPKNFYCTFHTEYAYHKAIMF